MISAATNTGTVHLVTEAHADDWYLRLRNRLLVLSAAVANPNNGPDILDAIAAEIDATIEMLPDEGQMQAALQRQPYESKGSRAVQ